MPDDAQASALPPPALTAARPRLPPGAGVAPFATAAPLSPRAKRLLGLALAASLVIHLALSLWPVSFDPESDAVPLEATLTELPPPPAPAAEVPAPKPKPAPKAAPKPPRRTVPVASVPGPVVLPPAAEVPVEPFPAGDPAPPPAAEPAAAAPAVEAAPAAEAIPQDVVDPRTLPPRVDLAYKVFWGTQGFEIGEAVYRFEHKDHRYRIVTLGQARGLAALVLRGQGKLESTGSITPEGLKPDLLRVERGGPDRVEFVAFDRKGGIITLRDGIEPLIEPTYDPLSLMWQYYFTPPTADVVSVAVATPRRLMNYTMTREGSDEITWGHGKVVAERWHRRSRDGKTDAYVWVAQSLRYIPVKIRVAHTERGTIEVLLDAIRVDDDPGSVGRDALVMPSPVEKRDLQAPMEPLAQPIPGETFPTMTGQ